MQLSRCPVRVRSRRGGALEAGYCDGFLRQTGRDAPWNLLSPGGGASLNPIGTLRVSLERR